MKRIQAVLNRLTELGIECVRGCEFEYGKGDFVPVTKIKIPITIAIDLCEIKMDQSDASLMKLVMTRIEEGLYQMNDRVLNDLDRLKFIE